MTKKVIRNFGGWKENFSEKSHTERCNLRNFPWQSKKFWNRGDASLSQGDGRLCP